jgi:hypothetical protein
MAYRPHGRAQVNINNPRAFARCDRCGFIYNHSDLRWQYDYRGPRLANLRILVCQPCYDKPQAQLKPILITQDPIPILNARPEDYVYANTNKRTTSNQSLTPTSVSGNGTNATFTFNIDSSVAAVAVGSTVVIQGMVPTSYNGTYLVTAATNTPAWTITIPNTTTAALAYAGQVVINIDPKTGLPVVSVDTRITDTGSIRSTQPIGIPTGFNADAVPPLYLTTQNNRVLDLVSLVSNGNYTVTATTITPHGLATNDSVAVEDVNNNTAFGFYSVTVVSATVFTYTVNTPIVAGSLLTANTRVSVVLVGLPTDYNQIPQTGT